MISRLRRLWSAPLARAALAQARARATAVAGLAALAVTAGLVRHDLAPAASGLDAFIAAATGLPTESALWVDAPGRASAPFAAFPVVFASPGHAANRDIFLAWVTRTADRRPLALESFHALTESREGDDFGLAVQGGRVAFATRVLGQVQSLQIYDFAATAPTPENGPGEPGPLAAMTTALTNWQAYGLARAPLRQQWVFSPPVEHAAFAFGDGGALTVNYASGGESGTAALHAGAEPGGGGRLELVPGRRPTPKPLIWAVNWVRNLKFVGPRNVEYLEEKFYRFSDFSGRVAHAMRANLADGTELDQGESLRNLAAEDLDAPPPPGPSSGHGPADIEPALEKFRKTDGRWRPIAFVPGDPGGPPPLFGTILHVDKERPYSYVRLTWADGHQTELHTVPGAEEPKPVSGLAGSGRIPLEPRIRERLIMAFTGGFLTIHGAYGMYAENQLLLPPVPGAATVILHGGAPTLFKTWLPGDTLPVGLAGMRQNLHPLIENGQINYAETLKWGVTGPGLDPIYTTRSALGVTAGGHLLYAWGNSLSATSLAEAMQKAGAVYAMHLEMNINHVNAELFRPGAGGKLEAKPLSAPLKKPNFPAFLDVSARDFFYVTLRRPPHLAGIGPGGDGEAGPPTSWQPRVGPTAGAPGPAVASARIAASGAPVDLVLFDTRQLTFIPGRGPREPTPATGHAPEHDAPDTEVVAVFAGPSNTTNPRAGLVIGGHVYFPPSLALGSLMVRDDGAATIEAPASAAALAGVAHWLQGEMLIDGGTRLPGPPGGEHRSRCAVGQRADESLVFATARDATWEAIAGALLRAGAQRALALAAPECFATLLAPGETATGVDALTGAATAAPADFRAPHLAVRVARRPPEPWFQHLSRPGGPAPVRMPAASASHP